MIRGTIRRQRLHWLPLLAASVLVVAALRQSAHAQSSATAELAQRLKQPVTLSWQGQQLAEALDRLAQTQRIAIWLDRRVDPVTSRELTVSDQPLRETLAAALTPAGYAAAPYHGVVYIGPEQTARELLTLSALARRSINNAPADIRRRWLQAEPWSFPRLSEPRALLTELVKPIGASLEDDHLVTHDLWPARRVPSLARIDRVVLLLAGFDLTCEISADGRHCRIVPIKRPVQISGSYTVSRGRAAAVEALLKELTTAKAVRRGAKLTLAATVEEHQRMREIIQGNKAAPPPPSSSRPAPNRDAQRFTLKISNQPVGPVIDQLAGQLKLTIAWNAPAAARNEMVSCEVREATLGELLTAILSPAELTFTRDGTNITISPKN